MIPALSQVCSLPAPFGADLEDYAAGKCAAVELWLTKVEEYLKTHTVADVRRLLDQLKMSAPVASFQGGLLASQGERRAEAWSLFGRRLQLCRELGVQTLIVACDVPPLVAQETIDRMQVSLRQAAQEAERAGVRIALEFQARSAFGNNLQTAAALVQEVASSHLGLCLDLFHFHVGPSKHEDLGYLTRENLFHVQVCDLADVPRELASDTQRILPGDGDIPLPPLFDRLRQIGYQGLVAVEILNPQLWQVPPLQMGEIALTALRRQMGLAG